MTATGARSTPLHLGAFIVLGSGTLLLGPSLDSLRDAAGVSKSRIGLLFTATAIGYLLGSLAAGRVLQRQPAHRVLAIGAFIMSAALLSITTVHALGTLALFEALLGLGAGLVDVTGNTVVLWIHKGGPIMNALHLCFGIGATLAPVLVGRSLAWSDGIAWAYVIVAAAFAVLGLLALSRPSPTDPHMVGERGLPSGKGKLVALGVAFFVSYVGVELGFSGWIFDYGVARGLDRVGQASWLGTGFLAAFTLGRLLSIPIAGRLRPLAVLGGDVLLCVVGLAILLMGRSDLAAMWAGTVVFGLGTASMFPTMLSLAEPHIPSTSAVTSAFLVGAALGSMFVPWIIGALIDRSGASAMPWVVLAGTVICALVIVAFDRTAKRDSAGAALAPTLGTHA